MPAGATAFTSAAPATAALSPAVPARLAKSSDGIRPPPAMPRQSDMAEAQLPDSKLIKLAPLPERVSGLYALELPVPPKIVLYELGPRRDRGRLGRVGGLGGAVGTGVQPQGARKLLLNGMSFRGDLLIERAVRREDCRLQQRYLVRSRRSDGGGRRRRGRGLRLSEVPMPSSCVAAAINSSGIVFSNDICCSYFVDLSKPCVGSTLCIGVRGTVCWRKANFPPHHIPDGKG